jgi:hypothetical protein
MRRVAARGTGEGRHTHGIDAGNHDSATADHVLQWGVGETLPARLCAGVQIRPQVRAGVHGHAQLRQQQRNRQELYEPAALTSDQMGLRASEYPRGKPRRQLKLA